MYLPSYNMPLPSPHMPLFWRLLPAPATPHIAAPPGTPTHFVCQVEVGPGYGRQWWAMLLVGVTLILLLTGGVVLWVAHCVSFIDDELRYHSGLLRYAHVCVDTFHTTVVTAYGCIFTRYAVGSTTHTPRLCSYRARIHGYGPYASWTFAAPLPLCRATRTARCLCRAVGWLVPGRAFATATYPGVLRGFPYTTTGAPLFHHARLPPYRVTAVQVTVTTPAATVCHHRAATRAFLAPPRGRAAAFGLHAIRPGSKGAWYSITHSYITYLC